MKDLICPFSATLVSEDFGCRKASRIVRRGGAEIACSSESAQSRCNDLHARMKEVSLPALGFEDDLLQMPHSAQLKIQYGGLLGLQRIVQTGEAPTTTLSNIDSLISAALDRFPSVEAIPFDELCTDITGYRLARRRKK